MKARYVFTILVGAFIMATIGVIFFGPDFSCPEYTLNSSTIITDPNLRPQGNWSTMKSPNNKEYAIERIIIDPDDPEVQDEPWRYAAYSEEEDIFWIADMPNYQVFWYGPFEGRPCLQ